MPAGSVLGIQQVVQPADYLCLVVDTTDDPDQGDVAVANLLGDRGRRDRLRLTGAASAAPQSPPHRHPHSVRQLLARAAVGRNSHAGRRVPRRPRGRPAAGSSWGIATSRSSAAKATSTPVWSATADSSTRREQPASTRPRWLQRYGNYSISSGYKLTRQVLADHRPTAIVCGNDRMAIGSLLALHSLGLDCPTDVSIIGFDDQPDVADQVRPNLTTVALPHLLMGRTAGRLMIDPAAEPSARTAAVPTDPAGITRPTAKRSRPRHGGSSDACRRRQPAHPTRPRQPPQTTPRTTEPPEGPRLMTQTATTYQITPRPFQARGWMGR